MTEKSEITIEDQVGMDREWLCYEVFDVKSNRRLAGPCLIEDLASFFFDLNYALEGDPSAEEPEIVVRGVPDDPAAVDAASRESEPQRKLDGFWNVFIVDSDEPTVANPEPLNLLEAGELHRLLGERNLTAFIFPASESLPFGVVGQAAVREDR